MTTEGRCRKCSVKAVAGLLLLGLMLATVVVACSSPRATPVSATDTRPAEHAATALLNATVVAPLRTPIATTPESVATQQPVPTRSPTPPLLAPIDALGKTGSPIQVDSATYRLRVDGLVEHPLSLSYAEILALSAVTQVVRLECPGFFVDYAEWSGPLVSTLPSLGD